MLTIKKSILLAFLIVVVRMTALCQAPYPPTPEYEYAMLRANDEEDSYVVQYSNSADKVHLEDVLRLPGPSETFTFTQARFICFKYLNDNGYELVAGSSCVRRHKEICEYTFKRLKQSNTGK